MLTSWKCSHSLLGSFFSWVQVKHEVIFVSFSAIHCTVFCFIWKQVINHSFIFYSALKIWELVNYQIFILHKCLKKDMFKFFYLKLYFCSKQSTFQVTVGSNSFNKFVCVFYVFNSYFKGIIFSSVSHILPSHQETQMTGILLGSADNSPRRHVPFSSNCWFLPV